jgi:protein-tyrosine phosphatase
MTDQRPEQRRMPDDQQRAAIGAARKRIDRVNEWLHLGSALSPEEYDRFREDDDADAERLEALRIVRRHVPVPDGGPPTMKQLVEIAEWVDVHDKSVAMYVHCKGGFGRAATMTVGLLVMQGSTLDDAVEQVRGARPEMRLNDEQMAWLRLVEGRFHGGKVE